MDLLSQVLDNHSYIDRRKTLRAPTELGDTSSFDGSYAIANRVNRHCAGTGAFRNEKNHRLELETVLLDEIDPRHAGRTDDAGRPSVAFGRTDLGWTALSLCKTCE